MASFTKRAIQESCIKLLEERPLDQITVKDIVEDCGVNRNTFYYHFADMPALLTEIVTQRTDEIIERYSSVDDLEQCLRAAVEFALEHRRAVIHIYRSANRDMIEEHLMRICRYAVEAYARTAIGDIPIREEDREILIRFFQCECFGQAVAWLGEGMRYDIEAQFARLCQIMHGMTEGLIRRCAQDAGGAARE